MPSFIEFKFVLAENTTFRVSNLSIKLFEINALIFSIASVEIAPPTAVLKPFDFIFCKSLPNFQKMQKLAGLNG